jgi:hypothetical protein
MNPREWRLDFVHAQPWGKKTAILVTRVCNEIFFVKICRKGSGIGRFRQVNVGATKDVLGNTTRSQAREEATAFQLEELALFGPGDTSQCIIVQSL